MSASTGEMRTGPEISGNVVGRAIQKAADIRNKALEAVSKHKDALVSVFGVSQLTDKDKLKRRRLLGAAQVGLGVGLAAAYFGPDAAKWLTQSPNEKPREEQLPVAKSNGSKESNLHQRNSPEIPPLPEVKEIVGNQNILVTMLKEKGKPSPTTVEQEKEILDRVTKFYSEASNGKVNLLFTILDWQEIEQDLVQLGLPSNSDHFNKIAALNGEKLEELKAKHLIPPDYTNNFQTRLVIVDSTGKPSIVGQGNYGPWTNSPYNEAYVNHNENRPQAASVQHELGHAIFGLGHVDSLVTQGGAGDFTNYRVEDVGSKSVMGSYGPELAGVQRFQLGWISKDQIQTATNSSEVILTPNQGGDNQGKKLLRIHKPDTNQFYYIEYSASDKTKPTLRFYLWDEKSNQVLEFLGTGGPYTTDGSEFYDKINNIRVKQTSHSDGEVKLAVQLNS